MEQFKGLKEGFVSEMMVVIDAKNIPSSLRGFLGGCLSQDAMFDDGTIPLS